MADPPYRDGFESGKAIPSRRLQMMRDRRLTGIRGGRGILVRETDDGDGGIQAIVETRSALRGVGGGGGGGTAATSPPPDIAETSETGTDTEYARADHTHGYDSTNVALLYSCETASDTAPSYPNDGDMYLDLFDNKVYQWNEVDGTWDAVIQKDGYMVWARDLSVLWICKYDGTFYSWKPVPAPGLYVQRFSWSSVERPSLKWSNVLWIGEGEPDNWEDGDILIDTSEI